MARTAKIKEPEEEILQPETLLKGLLDDSEGDHLNNETEIYYKISSGSLKLDVELEGGYGPGFHRMAGHNNSGKSPSAIELQSNFIRYHLLKGNKARGLFVRAEGRLSEENLKRLGIPYTTKVEEWRNGGIFILNCQKYEVIAKYISSLVRNNPSNTLYAVVIDSMDGLKVKADEGKQFDENAKVAGAPLLSKRFLSDLSLEFNIKGHMGILISQVATEIKIDPYAKTTPRDGAYSGGNAISHFVNITVEFNKFFQTDLILDPPTGKLNDKKTKILGHWAKVMIRKSLNEKNYVTVEYPIKHGIKGKSAVWVEYEIVDLLLEWSLASKAGAWIKVEPDLIKELKDNDLEIKEQHQGLDNFREYLEENPKITEYLFNKFKKLLVEKGE